MSTVVLDVAMSLDGFTAGPNIGETDPLGEDGERLHDWMWNTPDGGVDTDFKTTDAVVGAALIGRRTFDLGLKNWGGTPWPGVPTFVVTHTHQTRENLLGDNGGTFSFDGLENAARRAKDAAGNEEVLVLGAHLAGALLKAGLLDEVRIHLVPLLLGTGTSLFAGARAELVPEGQPVTGAMTHLRYRVLKPRPTSSM